MKTLVLDFSFRRLVALCDTPATGQPRVLALSCGDEKGSPLEQVEKVMKEAGASRDEVSRIVVGLGPGSYTGMRSSLAVAQGWSLGRGVAVVGVDSSLALACEARRRGLSGEVRVLIDAQRGEVYAADFLLDARGVNRVESLRILGGAALLPPAGIVVGPEARRWVPEASLVEISAEALLEAVTHSPVNEAPERLEPIYLRPVAFVKAAPSALTTPA